MPPRERQKLQPRGIEAILNTTQGRTNREQNRWEGAGGQGPFPVWNDPNPDDRRHSLDYMSPGWIEASAPRNNSGLMLAMANSPAVNKMKNIYSGVDPFFPDVDINDQQFGYDFSKNLWGGTLGFGGGYDTEDDAYNAYINWGIDF